MALSTLIFRLICATSICGFSTNSIVPAPSNEFLFTASISFGSEHICSGVILNKRWIICSALCLNEYSNANARTLQVRYGSHNRNYSEIKNDDIEKIIVHPHFQQESPLNNVALIKIHTEIQFIPTVVEAAILPTKTTAENDVVDAVGWEKIDKLVSCIAVFMI